MQDFAGRCKETNEYEGEIIEHFIKDIDHPDPNVVSVCQGTLSPKNSFIHRLKSFFKNAFLPANYPESVSEDYFDYQVWDSCQAFASSISGSLATQVSRFFALRSPSGNSVPAAFTSYDASVV